MNRIAIAVLSALLFVSVPVQAWSADKTEAPAKQTAKPMPAKVGRLLADPSPCTPLGEGERVRLDFDGAPLHDLAAEVGRALCKNFVIEPHFAQVPIVVLSSAEMPVSGVWAAFLAILHANELTVVERGGYYAIIPGTDGTRENVPTYGLNDRVPDEDRMVTKTFLIKDPDINATTNFLNIFKSGKGQIHPYGPARTVVVTDFASSVARIEWILEQISKSTPPAPAK